MLIIANDTDIIVLGISFSSDFIGDDKLWISLILEMETNCGTFQFMTYAVRCPPPRQKLFTHYMPWEDQITHPSFRAQQHCRQYMDFARATITRNIFIPGPTRPDLTQLNKQAKNTNVYKQLHDMHDQMVILYFEIGVYKGSDTLMSLVVTVCYRFRRAN